MEKGVAWLYRELPGLVEQGILTPDAADALRRHYGDADSESRAGWGQILLASFGALLVGGGIILILAHNWDGLARPARAGIALTLLVAAQLLTVFAVTRRARSAAWIEPASGLLVAAVGAAIALIGQTYHVGGSFEGLMFAWLWLVVPIPYLTGSALAAIAFWALLVVRVTNLGWRDKPFDPWLLVFAAFPFVVMQARRRPRSWTTAIVMFVATGSVFVVGSVFTVRPGWSGLWAVLQVSLLAAVIGAASWPPHRQSDEPWRQRLLVPAWLTLIVIAAILSFDDSWRPVSVPERALQNPSTMLSVLVALGCAVLASVLGVKLARAGLTAAATGAGAAALVVTMHVLAMFGWDGVGWIAFNLWLLAAGILLLLEGTRMRELGTANRGLLALGALIAARFFDTDLSFLARGIAFVIFGAGCFALNLWMMRRVRKTTK